MSIIPRIFRELSGDRMLNRSFCFLLLLCLAWPGAVPAQQQPAVPPQKPPRADLKIGNEGENWQALNDIKSGLQPKPPFVFQRDEQPEFVREIVRVQWRAGD